MINTEELQKFDNEDDLKSYLLINGYDLNVINNLVQEWNELQDKEQVIVKKVISTIPKTLSTDS